MSADPQSTLVVFSDDWGRHPSSCQHLVRYLLPTHDVVWVNTIGMRRVRLTVGDLRRVVGRLSQVGRCAEPQAGEDGGRRGGPRVVSPMMYPGFRRPWQRRFNARRMAGAVHHALKPGDRGGPRALRVAVTTLPITADLVGRLEVDRWVYYCVDDFSVWPGLDGAVMDAMERELVAKVDAVVCVSQVLCDRVASMGREAELLPHGVDLEHWNPMSVGGAAAPHLPNGGAACLFWGLLDERLDRSWATALAQSAALTLCGPGELNLPVANRLPATAYDALPALAAAADVLVMPYIDAPVTRAMQPLKLLEYLATYKPVVVRDLPSTRAWADCCDVVSSADEFMRVCLERARGGLPEDQRQNRDRRLPGESWSEKARRFEMILYPGSPASR